MRVICNAMARDFNRAEKLFRKEETVNLNYLQSGTSGSRAYKIKKLRQSIAAVCFTVAVIGLLHFGLRAHFSESPRIEYSQANTAVDGSSPFDVAKLQKPVHAGVATEVTMPSLTRLNSLPQNIIALIERGDYKQAQKLLLAQASAAVARSDDAALATVLSHLGELALLQSDIDTAEVYLAEALDLINQTGDEVAAAGIYVQMGRLHLQARRRARLASDAYDTLLVARWKISHGQFYKIESELRRAAENNLSLNRFGAAASVYETLFKGYSKDGNLAQAQSAGAEAVKLLAASGRKFDAEALVETMRQHGFSDDVFTELQAEIAQLSQEFNNSVQALGAARNYALLYNQLQARGDVVNAWRFRQLAGASQAKASMRAQYSRQPDVLVELYRSNTSMENAKNTLLKAQEVYQRHGMDTEVLKFLQEQIF